MTTHMMNVRTGLDAVITRALNENRIVGTVVLIARDGELVYQHAAGLADREAGTEMRVDTLFRLASVTKAIVCAAAMALSRARGAVARVAGRPNGCPSSGRSCRRASRRRSRFVTCSRIPPASTIGFSSPRMDHTPARMSPTASISPGCPCRKTSGASPARRSWIGRASRGGIRSPSTCSARSWSEPQASRCRRSSAERITRPLEMNDTAFTIADVNRLAVPYADAKPRAETHVGRRGRAAT